MDLLNITTKPKQKIKTQVLVVGAGAAGTSTAISAARNGAETMLVEYQGFLGGISTTLPWIGFHDREYRQVVKGLPHEIITRLQQRGAASQYALDPKCSSLVSVHTHHWKVLAMEMAEEAGVEVLLHTQAVQTIRDGDRIRGVIVENKSGRIAIEAEIVIDCSGDGDVAARGEVPWEKGRTSDGLVQAPSLACRIGGIDEQAFVEACKYRDFNYREWISSHPELWKKMMRRLESGLDVFVLGGFAGLFEKARQAGDQNLPQTRLIGVKTHLKGEMVVVSTRILGLDPTDAKSLSNGYTRLYAQVPDLMRLFNKYIPGCENAFLAEIAPLIGVRESRRIMGDYVLTADDLIEGREFEDAVAMGGYHIDIHRPKGTWVESHNVRAYTIPLRSLIARDVEGLMMAGKCISATHEAIASTRVIPICMSEGHAAGAAAAMAVQSGKSVRKIDISVLQDRLVEQGAEIGRTLGEPNREAIDKIGQLPFEEPPTSGDEDEVAMSEEAWVE